MVKRQLNFKIVNEKLSVLHYNYSTIYGMVRVKDVNSRVLQDPGHDMDPNALDPNPTTRR